MKINEGAGVVHIATLYSVTKMILILAHYFIIPRSKSDFNENIFFTRVVKLCLNSIEYVILKISTQTIDKDAFTRVPAQRDFFRSADYRLLIGNDL